MSRRGRSRENTSDDLKRFTSDLNSILTRSRSSLEQIRMRELEDHLESERDARIRVSTYITSFPVMGRTIHKAIMYKLNCTSCDGRVVKALDLKSNGIFPHRFEPCSQRSVFVSGGEGMLGTDFPARVSHRATGRGRELPIRTGSLIACLQEVTVL